MDGCKYFKNSPFDVKFDAEYESDIRFSLQSQGVKLEDDDLFKNYLKSSPS